MDEIAGREAVLKAYVLDAVAVETSGAKVVKRTAADMAWPEEMQADVRALAGTGGGLRSTDAGRQRGYLLHFAAPKQAKTRESRIAKCAPSILAGKGLDDL